MFVPDNKVKKEVWVILGNSPYQFQVGLSDKTVVQFGKNYADHALVKSKRLRLPLRCSG